jgi:hypothetical protein
MGKWAYLGVHCCEGDVSDLISAVPAGEFSGEIYGPVFEELFGVFEVVFLVVLDGG